jgi:Fic family protein
MPSELGVLIMRHPYIKVIDLVAALQCHRQTAATYLKHLVKMGILIEKTSGREKMYLNKELLDILAN